MRWLAFVFALGACHAEPALKTAPCLAITGESELRAKDAAQMVEDLARRIRLPPADEALRNPTSLEDLERITQRDVCYLFASGAAYARSLDSVEGRFHEARFELLLGESQLVASQVLTMQEAWIGSELRVARANLASGEPATDRGRMLAQLIRGVEDGNKIGDALGVVAPSHIARGAEITRRLRAEAPSDPRTFALLADYHRLRGEWPEFDAMMKPVEQTPSPAGCYLRAMEQLERYRRPDNGASKLRECLKTYPRFVRAQSSLVLMATNATDAARELEKLAQLNEDHYMIMLLEPTIAADRELQRMQNAP